MSSEYKILVTAGAGYIAARMPARRWRGHASAYMGESVIDPGKYYRNNVVDSLTLLDAARAARVNRT